MSETKCANVMRKDKCLGRSSHLMRAHSKRLKTSYILLSRYLNYLTRIGFIDVVCSGKQILYRTSEKGFEFLRLYHNLLKMLYGNVEGCALKLPVQV
jgi:Mn-dependent DtxR family transcriptional regulator